MNGLNIVISFMFDEINLFVPSIPKDKRTLSQDHSLVDEFLGGFVYGKITAVV